ncbi:Thioesterase/thiol ester dehydrase-isomerase [Xylaria sp. CBS 124048]|nr:Thioesterase/thiol ester dehydrase-isomerase [Xylaria sp. CBS 124048]
MSPRSAERVRKGQGRLPYQEALSLIALPHKGPGDGTVKRYMSRRSVWVTGDDFTPLAVEQGLTNLKPGITAYGGHVYSQAGLAASLAFRSTREAVADRTSRDKKFGIHTIHGFFSEAGHHDRPFVYEVTNLASNPSFPNILVTARQPTSPSRHPRGDHYLEADGDMPLGPVCFSAIVTFRPSGISQFNCQESSPQVRYARILRSRRPMEWDPAPIADIEGLLAAVPGSKQAVGLFPGLEMRKVDMRAYNANRPMHERRELILYRLLAPLPVKETPLPRAGVEVEISGPDAHICAHAFGADRNGLLMVGNHAGFGREFARAASLSYSFVVHVNAEDAVMKYCEDDEDDEQWWIQETSFPRVQVGRGIVHSKIWSPRGQHVATEYQDGIVRRLPRDGDEVKGKL